MRAALLLTLLALDVYAQSGARFRRLNERCPAGRSSRGLGCDDLAFFELAPASGAGMGAACACAAITGAKGETVTFSRTGAATCSPLGLVATGITTASLAECGGNLPRVEASGGVSGLRVESARTNALLRFIDLANATWADVGTPALTGAQPSPFSGTYANLGVQVDDNDAAAQEGRAQTVTVTAAVAHTMHCYVRAGTLTSATVSLDGTTASITGLSTSTWSIVEVTDASSSGVAISAQVLNGAAASDVGTVQWGGCQVEQGLYRTSIIPTVASAVTRNSEVAGFALSIPAPTQVCTSATVQVPALAAYAAGSGVFAPVLSTGAVSAAPSSPYMWPYTATLGGNLSIDGVGSSGAPSGWAPGTLTPTLTGRYVAGHNGTAWSICVNGACSANGVASAWAAPTYTAIKLFATTAVDSSAIWSRVQVDPSFLRCTP